MLYAECTAKNSKHEQEKYRKTWDIPSFLRSHPPPPIAATEGTRYLFKHTLKSVVLAS